MKNKKMTSTVKKLITLAALLIVGLFFPRLVSTAPNFVETVFSQGLYVWISTALGWINSLVPLSLTEIVLFALIIAALVLIIIYIIRFVCKRTTMRGALNGLLTVLITAAVALNAFYFTWGLNYSRPTLYAMMELPEREYGADEVYALCAYLIDEANALSADVPRDSDGVFKLESDIRDCFNRISETYKKALLNNSLPSRHVYPAKAVSASRMMSRAGISGLFMPVMTEANVNTDQPDIALAFTAAHENAHYLGFAREGEANFLAYIVCMESGDADIRYSGTVNALMYSLSAAIKADPERYQTLTERISDEVRTDINDYFEYWNDYKGATEDFFSNLNDYYLKFNDQENGAASYGDVVNLLLAYGVEEE